jgi:carbonic anhydrase
VGVEDIMKLVGCWVICCTVALVSGSVGPSEEKSLPTPAAAWERLKEGNARYVADKPAGPRRDARRRGDVAKGQSPFAIVLSCADSRVVPELLFDQGLGDMFVVRVAGNVGDRGIIGSMEYAVGNLKTPLIVVLGHEQCGAVKAVIHGEVAKGDLGWLLKQVHAGKTTGNNKGPSLADAIALNALFQAKRLSAESPLLRESVATGRVRIVAGVYSLDTGAVRWLEGQTGKKP